MSTFTANEVATAVTTLSEAGVSDRAIVRGALIGSLALASAGNIPVTSAALITAHACTRFTLEPVICLACQANAATHQGESA